MRRRNRWVVLVAVTSASVVACGDGEQRSICGDRGREVSADEGAYCVYDAIAVRTGGSITCPREAPRSVAVGEGLVCAPESANASARDLPPEVCALVTVPCGAEIPGDPDAGAPMDGAVDASDPVGDGATPAVDGATDVCPPLDERPVIELRGAIDHDDTWTCASMYVLRDSVFVTGGATLTLEAGTVVRAGVLGGLFVTPSGRIDARGTRDAPIVMTSVEPEGTRLPGSWVGLYMAGRSPLADSGTTELLTDDPRLMAGGDDPTHDCGRLRYVRVEFAGQRRSGAMLMGGCGTGTVIDHVQIHMSSADALEIHGGTVDLRHVYVTDPRERAMYWSRGWRGRGQFIAVRALGGGAERNLFEDRNFELLETRATLTNVTITSVGATRTRSAFTVEGAGEALLSHAIVWGNFAIAVDLLDTPAAMQATAMPGVDLVRSFFYGMGDDPTSYFTTESPLYDDGGFDETAWLTDAARVNRFGIDPLLAAPERLVDPDLVPALGSPASSAGPLPGDPFFDASASYAGAFAPGGDDWTRPWSALPPD